MGSYSVWAIRGCVSNDQQPKKLWAPAPLLARAQKERQSIVPLVNAHLQATIAGSWPLAALTKLETNKAPTPRPRRLRETCCWFGRVPADWSPDRLPFPSAEWRADARVVWRAVASRWNAQLREKRARERRRERRREDPYRGLGIDTETLPSGLGGATNRPIGGGKGGRSLLRRSDPLKPVLCEID